MEIGSIAGIALGFTFIFLSVLITAGTPAGITAFIDAGALMVVLGGSIASGLISVKLKNMITALKAFAVIFKPPALDPASAIDTVVRLANTARKEGVLALEESAANMDDAFLKKGIMLIVDGTDPELVKGIMETELGYTGDRHEGIAGFYNTMGTFAPAWGMIGTMIGLVLMLGDLDDPDNLGPMMAIALITTFYGCVFANIFFSPVAAKLQDISKEEMLYRTVMVEGMLSIQAGENPRIIEEKLKSFLAPALRGDVGASGGGGGGGGGAEA